MTVYLNGFPGCCTAEVLSNFEAGQEWDGKAKLDQGVQDRIYNEVVQKLTHSKRKRMAVVFAATTHFQVNAEVVLEELGFYSSPQPVTKGKAHPKTHVTPWFICLDEWEAEDFPLRELTKLTTPTFKF